MNNRYTMTSPLPWHVELVKYHNSPEVGSIRIVSATGECIVDAGPGFKYGHEHANVALIVNTLNEREKLIELIGELVDLAEQAIFVIAAEHHTSTEITDETTMMGKPVKPLLDKAHRVLEGEKK